MDGWTKSMVDAQYQKFCQGIKYTQRSLHILNLCQTYSYLSLAVYFLLASVELDCYLLNPVHCGYPEQQILQNLRIQ